MGIEIMTGATLFALIRLAFATIFLFMLYRIVKKLTKDSEEKQNFWPEISVLTLMMLLVFFFPTSAAPKLTIDTPPNRELIEYQRGTQVEIVPAEPRVEYLQGFTPLKEE